jgi:hypothetical protein
MDVRKLNRLKGRLDDLRRKGGIKSSEVEALAKALGRVHDKRRGKEPTWVNRDFPGLRPLTIPHHSTDLNKYTAGSILDQLEGDIEKIEESLEKLTGEVKENE